MQDRSNLDALTPLISEAAAVAGDADLGRMLRILVVQAQAATGAPYVALGVIGEHGVLTDFIYEGVTREQADRIGHPPSGRGVLGTVIRKGRTIIVDSISDHPDSVGFPAHHPEMKAFLGVPVSAGGETFGNLYLADKEGGFSEEDVKIVEALSRIAGAAVQTARLQTRLRQVAIVEDRHRIARDLHDSVIQDLFAVGLNLQNLSAMLGESRTLDVLTNSIDTLDRSVNRLRHYIFELKDITQPAVGIDERLQVLVARMGSAYPTKVQLTLEHLESRETDEEVVLLVTEALSNALRHSQAEKVEISLTRRGNDLVVQVTDDGVGFDPETVDQGMGIANMRSRALSLGGTLQIDAHPGQGTAVEVRIPLTAHSDR